MRQVAHIRPVNSLIFVSDANGGEAPIPVRGAMVWSTPSCVAIVCYPEQDGPTEVTLDRGSEVDAGQPPIFEGHLEVPNGEVVVSTVEGKTVLEMTIEERLPRLRIWTNHSQWPDKVVIGIG